MKALVFRMLVLTAIVTVGTVWAGEDEGETQLRLEVDLVDGSHIIGTPSIASVPVQTSYAKMDVALKEILTIKIAEDHETASFDLRNGDKLKGVINLEPIKLETVFGSVKIGAEHIRDLRVVLSGGALPKTLRKGLVLYYSFDGDKDGKVTDENWEKNNGEAKGAKWTSNGKFGGAYEFDGKDDYVLVPDSPDWDFGTGDLSVAFWFTKSNTNRAHAMSFGTDQNNLSFNFDDGLYGSWVYWMGSGTPHVWTKNSYHDGKWHHLAFVRTGGAFKLYMDGECVDQVELASNIKITGPLIVGAGSSTGGWWWNGTIDEVMVHNRALSESEVKQIYDAQK